ncbi:MAG TPA: VanW family protein [Chthoniobacteraceae bacterium]|nr:VanW family protein [Chthoniobacteraceae bacterium]
METAARAFVKPGPERAIPTRIQAALFSFKAWCFRAKRLCMELAASKPRRFEKANVNQALGILSEARGVLRGNQRPEEQELQAGKIENLRKAARYLNGLVIPAGAVFSFWAHVPRPTRARGFVKGRELREGCLIPNVGGGLCQLSNALYQAALDAGLEIVERHAHSRLLPGAKTEMGRDATVFWNYVDLRFRANTDCQLEVLLGSDELIVRVRAKESSPAAKVEVSRDADFRNVQEVGSCGNCGVTGCFRHGAIPPAQREAFSAWLVDAWWPEHQAWMERNHRAGDWLFAPLDAKRSRGRYPWNGASFSQVRLAPLQVMLRSWRSRKLAAQGAARQRALLEMDGKLARHYARAIPYAATHLAVSQNLLPFLWRDGVLGGRTFDVLMTRLPMDELQRVLDRAATQWPVSPTLADFRAPAWIAEAEREALAEARRWITPHSAIARLGGCRAVKLDWAAPDHERQVQASAGRALFFPASTLGRKGAYEVREAARELGLKVILGGPVRESPDFWNRVETAHFDLAHRWPAGICAVVLPAWVENQPRRLLRAASAGLPVIASAGCGLTGVPGVTEIPAGDIGALMAALSRGPHDGAHDFPYGPRL